jgi:hypothetical protein
VGLHTVDPSCLGKLPGIALFIGLGMRQPRHSSTFASPLALALGLIFQAPSALAQAGPSATMRGSAGGNTRSQPDASCTRLDLDPLSASLTPSLTHEGALGADRRGSYRVSARKSYLHDLTTKLANGSGSQGCTDVDLKVDCDLNPGNHLSLTTLLGRSSLSRDAQMGKLQADAEGRDRQPAGPPELALLRHRLPRARHRADGADDPQHHHAAPAGGGHEPGVLSPPPNTGATVCTPWGSCHIGPALPGHSEAS